MNERYDVLIVGAGHGGSQAAIQLRAAGFDGSIAIVGDEAEPPYERPPLSKDYLAGNKPFDRILVRPEAFWAERAIDLIAGARVSRIDAAAQCVTVTGDRTIGYDRLIWSAGGRARPLPCLGGDGARVFTVRERRDVDALNAALPPQGRVLVVGGGYIGLEAAAVLRARGHPVVLVEAADRLLGRVAGRTLADFVAAEHRTHGVDLRLGVTVTRIDASAAGVTATLSDGARIDAAVVVAGVGIVPEVGPLIAAGAVGGNGVDVDQACRTGLRHVYAIGDCAAHANVWADGEMVRIESVQNAHDMAKVSVADIIGGEARHDALPWFWSNQYDLKLQTVGLAIGHDAEIARGDPADRSFSVVYLKARRVVALDCVNAAKDYVQGRRLIEARAEPDPDRLADPAVPLKDLLSG